MADKIGVSTGKGFLKVYKDADGVLHVGDYKIPTHETLYNGAGITYTSNGSTTGVSANSDDLLEITYAVDGDHTQKRTVQIMGQGWLVDYDASVAISVRAFVYVSAGELKWGTASTGADPIIYRVDKVIV